MSTAPAPDTTRRTVGVAAAGTFLALVAYTVPLTTLPETARALGAGAGGQAWILSSMSLGLAVALLPTGALADDHGRRRGFVLGAVLLAVASVAGALSPGTVWLVLARVVQGVGAAAVIACSLGLIAHAVPAGPARTRATGVWGASLGAGIAVGPLASAGLAIGLGWPGPYWLLAVGGVVLAVAGQRWLLESRASTPRAVDTVGVLLFSGTLAALLAGLVLGRQGWTSAGVLLLLGLAVAGAVAFPLWEARRTHPMLDLALFRNPTFVAATVAGLATGAGIISATSYSSTVVQRGLGGTALDGAWVLLGWSVTSVVTSLLARRLPARVTGQAQLVLGLLGVTVGMVMLTGVAVGDGPVRLLPGLLVAGAASGVLNAALGRQAVASVPTHLGSTGSGANNTARYLGAAVGVTVVTVVVTRGGSSPAAVLDGWDSAVLVTAAVSLAGAVVVLACRPRPPA
ncbi:MFS transporter [Rhodococcus aerolatus]